MDRNPRENTAFATNSFAANLESHKLQANAGRAKLRAVIATLNFGHIGIAFPGVREAIALAAEYQFDGVTLPLSGAAEFVRRHGLGALEGALHDHGVSYPAFGLPVEWRKDEETLAQGLDTMMQDLEDLGDLAPKRTATWILPGSDSLPLEANIEFHLDRLTPIARELQAYDVKLGLEFIGTKSLRDQFAHPFHYRLSDMLDLAHRVGPNGGLLLDAYHWYTAGDTLDAITSCSADDIVLVHVNDAISGRSREEQIDNDRALPLETGVIDLEAFISALSDIGYQGPVEVEPFSARLKTLSSDEERLRQTSEALRATLALAR